MGSNHQRDKIWREFLEVIKLAILAPLVPDAVALTYKSAVTGGQLPIGGNGGSAADTQHIAAELPGRVFTERQPFRAIRQASLAESKREHSSSIVRAQTHAIKLA